MIDPVKERLTADREISRELAALTDDEVAARLDDGAPLGAGIGGGALRITAAGRPIFAKKLVLTDFERAPAMQRSTANLFGLPAILHFGVGTIGSSGFGAWRELAAHELTSAWVRAGECAGFPLLHHWRALPLRPPRSEELDDIEGAVRYWESSGALGRQLEAKAKATHSLVLCLEYFPQTLRGWLNDRISEGDAGAIERAAARLRETVAFANGRGLFHFDAHFQNVLIDGETPYLTDFGLAAAECFGLSAEEADFLRAHRSYDLRYVETGLASRIVNERFGAKRCDAVLREYSERPEPGAGLDAIIERHARVALVMREFIRKFRDESRETPYPAEELG